MNELSVSLMCVQMRTGIELWMEKDRADKLQAALQNITSSKFIMHDGQTINSADIVGIFDAKTMEETTRRKNFEYKCKRGTWHAKGQTCDCAAPMEYFEAESTDDRTPEEIEANRVAMDKLRQSIKKIGNNIGSG